MIVSDSNQSIISKRLAKAGPVPFSVYCIIAAFATYFCMYAFRKPFTAGTYDGISLLGISYKTILIASQVFGYTISKFIGIKFVSEIDPRRRAVAIVVLILIAELALLLFAITPAPWSFGWLFLNGLPLGMVFGLVLGFLEGRRVTEALSAGLCASFIVSSGFVKSVGRSLIQDWNVSEYWMPFMTGLAFFVPLLISVWLLAQIPPPNAHDELQRYRRAPMDRKARKDFLSRHFVGIAGLVVVFVLLTIGRSLRDDFAVEIWQDLGVDDEPDVFARSEFWVMIAVMLVSGMVIFIRNNRTAFLSSIGMLFVGFALVLLAVTGQRLGWFSPMSFMVLLGFGLYVPYVIFHTTIFERMIAAFRETGTVGYLMYLADSAGYLGYVVLMVLKNVLSSETSETNFLDLLIWVSTAIAIASSGISLFLVVYFRKQLPRDEVPNLENSLVSES